MKLEDLRDGPYLITPVDHPDIVVGAVDENGVTGPRTFDLTDERVARSLLEQEENYRPADDEARALLDLIHAEQEEAAEAHAAAEQADEMKVADLLPLLDAMTAEELEAARARELAGKARATVLKRIDELTYTNTDKGA